MPQTIKDALKNATFTTDGDTYRLIKLPQKAITVAAGIIAEIGEPFCVLIADKSEVTLLIPDEAVTDFAHRMIGYEQGETYKLITVEATLEPDLIGFMAVISKTLADANVGVFPYAAYTTDHIAVPEAQINSALDALEQLKASYM